MSYTQVSVCPKCGSPIYIPSVWGGITPPPTTHSCNCYTKTNKIKTTTANDGIMSEIIGSFKEIFYEF